MMLCKDHVNVRRYMNYTLQSGKLNNPTWWYESEGKSWILNKKIMMSENLANFLKLPDLVDSGVCTEIWQWLTEVSCSRQIVVDKWRWNEWFFNAWKLILWAIDLGFEMRITACWSSCVLSCSLHDKGCSELYLQIQCGCQNIHCYWMEQLNKFYFLTKNSNQRQEFEISPLVHRTVVHVVPKWEVLHSCFFCACFGAPVFSTLLPRIWIFPESMPAMYFD